MARMRFRARPIAEPERLELSTKAHDWLDVGKPTQSELCLEPVCKLAHRQPVCKPKSSFYKTEYGVAIKTPVIPILKYPDLVHVTKGLHTYTNTEWKFYGYQIFQFPPDHALRFIQFRQPVVELNVEYAVVGFLCGIDAIYKVHAKTEAKKQTMGSPLIERVVKVKGSKPGATWEVLVYKNGETSCNCPSWIYHNGRVNGCKHTKLVNADEVPF